MWWKPCRAVLNDSYRTNLCLLHAPYMIAIACMHIASVLLGRSIQSWLESLTCNFDEVKLKRCNFWKASCPPAYEALKFIIMRMSSNDQKALRAQYRYGVDGLLCITGP